MRVLLILLSIMILSLSLHSTISAKSSEMFVDHLTDLIWTDCKGKDIQINHAGILRYTATNQNVSLIKWPYNKDYLRNALELLDEQPYRDYLGPCETKNKSYYDSGWDGCGILTCQDNRLNIDYDTYYWNGTKVDVPNEEFKISSGNNSQIVVTQGDKSPVTTGDRSPITQQECNLQIKTQIAVNAGIKLSNYSDIKLSSST